MGRCACRRQASRGQPGDRSVCWSKGRGGRGRSESAALPHDPPHTHTTHSALRQLSSPTACPPPAALPPVPPPAARTATCLAPPAAAAAAAAWLAWCSSRRRSTQSRAGRRRTPAPSPRAPAALTSRCGGGAGRDCGACLRFCRPTPASAHLLTSTVHAVHPRCCCCCCCRLQDTIVAAGYVLHIGQVAAGAEIKVGDAVTTK